MSSRLVFAGSKRAARATAAAEREVLRVQRELREIAQLAPFIRDEAHLQQILDEVADPDQREAVAKLLGPFLLFRVTRTEDATPC